MYIKWVRIRSMITNDSEKIWKYPPLFLNFLIWCVFVLLLLGATLSRAQVQDESTLNEEDRKIEHKIKGIFEQIDRFEDLSVEVRSGVAVLRGNVVFPTTAIQAEEIVSKQKGIIAVDNQIAEIRDFKARIEPVISRISEKAYDWISMIPLLVLAGVLIFLFWVLARWIASWNRFFNRLSDNVMVSNIVRQIAKGGIMALGILIALEILNATAMVGALLGTAGVLGIALGFAFRDLIENYIASIMLSLRRPFSPNDFVSIDGDSGKVIRLTSRATILMTLDGNHLRLPNAKVFKANILNYTHNPERRFEFAIGVGTNINLNAVLSVGSKVLKNTEGVLANPVPFGLIDDLGDSNVGIRFYAWVDQRTYNFGKVRTEAIRAVKDRFEDEDFDMPEPIYNLRLRKAEQLPGETAKKKDSPGQLHVADLKEDKHLDEQIQRERSRGKAGEDLLSVGKASELEG